MDAPAPAKLILHQFDYPGWQARLDQRLPLSVSSTRNGLVQVWVPAGQHSLTFTLTARWPERLGYAISSLAWLLWLGGVIRAARPHDRKRDSQGG
ncbi:hypothetical protein ACSZOK_12565 [Aeromonas veronii]|uniref:hypothetical protein n=1 Tax=Aeromonas veronii TaxID=654 RepID=UPI003EC79398